MTYFPLLVVTAQNKINVFTAANNSTESSALGQTVIQVGKPLVTINHKFKYQILPRTDETWTQKLDLDCEFLLRTEHTHINRSTGLYASKKCTVHKTNTEEALYE